MIRTKVKQNKKIMQRNSKSGKKELITINQFLITRPDTALGESKGYTVGSYTGSED